VGRAGDGVEFIEFREGGVGIGFYFFGVQEFSDGVPVADGAGGGDAVVGFAVVVEDFVA
jgi:hypothetical protein